MNRHVIGIDSCGGGWPICRINVSDLTVDLVGVAKRLADVLKRERSSTHFAVDIPIGLPEIGFARQCDLRARQLLTKTRASSVFPTPARELLAKLEYSKAIAYSMAICGKGISKQGHALCPKIAEADSLMTAGMQERVFEVHPELCFWGLAGRPMQHAKRSPEGYEERRRVLSQVLSTSIPERPAIRRLGLPIEPDDLLDAFVAGCTAYGAWKGNTSRIPAHPELDCKGLRMEMVYWSCSIVN